MRACDDIIRILGADDLESGIDENVATALGIGD